MVYAFSKDLAHHRAALALGYAWYNLGRIVRTLRVTPAMQAGVARHVWTLEEFLDALLAEPAGEKPTAKPLRHLAPEGTARELADDENVREVYLGIGVAEASTKGWRLYRKRRRW